MNEKRSCLCCADEITGRIDKKFCSDQCRSEYNNRGKKRSNSYVRRVNGILQRNRRILAELNPQGKIKVDKLKLTDRGFNFRFYTSTHTTKKGDTYYFCYEHGYLPLENDFYALVSRNEY